ncbi:uncharacterized protein [Spinacia oleracea]|uniref:Uncharacterized protein isoform X2 n=1 Tax=Spinacia oleracea TaxID=3562 RepID=A0ABM3RVT5_SPIOL|nr:uncharacterized protein LOC110790519 isoform X2 [Spinacia oleracea]
MAYSLKIGIYVLVTLVICTVIISFFSAVEEYDYEPEIGVIGGHPGQGAEDQGHEGDEEDHGTSADPTHIIDGALVCFHEKHLYSQCDESCILIAKGELHVPHDHVDEFCSGPCLEETNLVLDYIDGIMDHFIFFNKATTQDVRETILDGCGHGDKRRFFDIGEHIEADEGRGIIGSKATKTVLSDILISIIGQIVLLL